MKTRSPMVDFKYLSPNDQKEIERFTAWMRLVSEAHRAGVPRTEAAFALYEDVFEDADGFYMDIDPEAFKAMDEADAEVQRRYEDVMERDARK